MAQTPQDHESHFKNINYPAVLEIRVISDSDFDCESLLAEKNITPLKKAISLSKNEKFKTFKFTYKYRSYDHYIEIRTFISQQPQVQIIL